jgi:hypothetical protein
VEPFLGKVVKKMLLFYLPQKSKYITNVKEFIWLQELFKNINFKQQRASILYNDNQSCIALAKNPKIHERSKHIYLHYHFLWAKVERKKIQIK